MLIVLGRPWLINRMSTSPLLLPMASESERTVIGTVDGHLALARLGRAEDALLLLLDADARLVVGQQTDAAATDVILGLGLAFRLPDVALIVAGVAADDAAGALAGAALLLVALLIVNDLLGDARRAWRTRDDRLLLAVDGALDLLEGAGRAFAVEQLGRNLRDFARRRRRPAAVPWPFPAAWASSAAAAPRRGNRRARERHGPRRECGCGRARRVGARPGSPERGALPPRLRIGPAERAGGRVGGRTVEGATGGGTDDGSDVRGATGLAAVGCAGGAGALSGGASGALAVTGDTVCGGRTVGAAGGSEVRTGVGGSGASAVGAIGGAVDATGIGVSGTGTSAADCAVVGVTASGCRATGREVITGGRAEGRFGTFLGGKTVGTTG